MFSSRWHYSIGLGGFLVAFFLPAVPLVLFESTLSTLYLLVRGVTPCPPCHFWCLPSPTVTGITAWHTWVVGSAIWSTILWIAGASAMSYKVHELCYSGLGVKRTLGAGRTGSQALLSLPPSYPWLQELLWQEARIICTSSPATIWFSAVKDAADVARGLGLQAHLCCSLAFTSSVCSSSPTFRCTDMDSPLSWVLSRSTFVVLWMFYRL